MSEADKMFEELGYEQEIGQDEIFYYQLNGAGEKFGFTFYLKDREIMPACFERKENVAIYFTMQELQAINKKCQELGWI